MFYSIRTYDGESSNIQNISFQIPHNLILSRSISGYFPLNTLLNVLIDVNVYILFDENISFDSYGVLDDADHITT
jgi:hypothetical protein